jgi:hypothetical protein
VWIWEVKRGGHEWGVVGYRVTVSVTQSQEDNLRGCACPVFPPQHDRLSRDMCTSDTVEMQSNDFSTSLNIPARSSFRASIPTPWYTKASHKNSPVVKVINIMTPPFIPHISPPKISDYPPPIFSPLPTSIYACDPLNGSYAVPLCPCPAPTYPVC